VYLPRAEQAPAAKETQPGEGDVPGGTETILLVEDEAAVRRAARTILERGGYTVLEAREGSEALLLSRSFSGHIHLLVTDVVMPGMGGRETAEQVRATRPGLRVLYISGYTDDPLLHGQVAGHESDFLQKPFSREILLRAVRKALASRGAVMPS
jgi:CheY-like chemotaxis protein